MNAQFLAIYKKEMRDMVRDRRAVFAAFSFAFVGPLMMLVISFLLKDDITPYNRDKVAIAGLDQAPGIKAAFVNADFDIIEVDRPEGIPNALPEGVGGLIVIAPDFQERLAAGEQAEILIYSSETSPKLITKARRISRVISAYEMSVASDRLLVRGIPLLLLQPFDVQRADLAEESFAAQYFGDAMTLILILSPFTAGMSVAIDTLAGERERNSLQSLLAQPVSGWHVVLGKWLMVTTFGTFGTLLGCATFFASLFYAGGEEIDLTLHVTAFNFFMTVIILIPLAMLIASLQLLISIQVKSFKEGQTYAAFLTFAPMVLGYIKMFASDKLPEFISYFPVFSHMASLGGLLFSNKVVGAEILLSLTFSILGSAICLFFTARFVNNERLLDAT